MEGRWRMFKTAKTYLVLFLGLGHPDRQLLGLVVQGRLHHLSRSGRRNRNHYGGLRCGCNSSILLGSRYNIGALWVRKTRLGLSKEFVDLSIGQAEYGSRHIDGRANAQFR